MSAVEKQTSVLERDGYCLLKQEKVSFHLPNIIIGSAYEEELIRKDSGRKMTKKVTVKTNHIFLS